MSSMSDPLLSEWQQEGVQRSYLVSQQPAHCSRTCSRLELRHRLPDDGLGPRCHAHSKVYTPERLMAEMKHTYQCIVMGYRHAH